MNAGFPPAYVTALVGFLDHCGHHPSTRRYWTWLSKTRGHDRPSQNKDRIGRSTRGLRIIYLPLGRGSRR